MFCVREINGGCRYIGVFVYLVVVSERGPRLSRLSFSFSSSPIAFSLVVLRVWLV